jgi:hypothetical protein
MTNNIEKILKVAKKNSALVIGTSLILIIAIIVPIKYKFGSQSQQTSKIQIPAELIQRMDKLIDSIDQKTMAGVLSLEMREVDLYDQLSLKGILYSNHQPLAIINNYVVGLGDEIEGFRVVEILEGSATLRDKNGKDRVIYLYETE